MTFKAYYISLVSNYIQVFYSVLCGILKQINGLHNYLLPATIVLIHMVVDNLLWISLLCVGIIGLWVLFKVYLLISKVYRYSINSVLVVTLYTYMCMACTVYCIDIVCLSSTLVWFYGYNLGSETTFSTLHYLVLCFNIYYTMYSIVYCIVLYNV